MKTLHLTLITLFVFLFTVSGEAVELYVSTADGLVSYTDFNLSTKTIIGTSPGGGNRGLDVDSQGNVYVAYTSGNIYRYDRNPDGTLNANYYLYASGLGGTHGIGIDSNDNLYSIDHNSGNIYILSSSWTAGSSINASTPYLSSPVAAHGISFDENGYIYVSCFGGSVYKYNSAGSQIGVYAAIHSSTTVITDILYTVADNVYTMPLLEDGSAPGYTTSSPEVTHLISGIGGSVTDIEFDDDNNMYLSSYYGGLIYMYDEYGNPVGSGIFDSSISYPHFMALWDASENPVVPEPATVILIGLSLAGLLKKNRKL